MPSEPLWAAFQRHDKYGELGIGPLSMGEKIRLVVLAVLVVPIKSLGTLGSLLSFWLFCRLSFVLPASVRTEVVAAAGKVACRCCLWWLGFWRVSWVQVGVQDGRGGSNGSINGSGAVPVVGIVSNHLSWCDILLHMSHSFPCFVARAQTSSQPIIGIISQLMGCLYVDRESSSKVDDGQPRVSDRVRQRMQQMAAGELPHARPLLLFPEGTTTNGRYLLPFKTGAFLAGEPLQPVVIRYGEGGFSPCWEMISAARHIFLLLANPVHTVTCFELPVYHPSEAERKDPKLYAHNVRKLMMDFSGLQGSNATYADKMQLVKRLKQQYGLK